MIDLLPLFERCELPCGHVLQFVPNGEAGAANELAHQKDTPIKTSYIKWLKTIGDLGIASVLEIGVCRGGSLAIWNALFGNWGKHRVVGVDRDLDLVTATCAAHYGCQWTRNNGGIELKAITMPDPVIRELGMFDLVIDDGEHGFNSIAANFTLAWSMVNLGGFYIVEDWHPSFLQPIEVLTLFGEMIRAPSESKRTDVHSIEIYDAMIVINKSP